MGSDPLLDLDALVADLAGTQASRVSRAVGRLRRRLGALRGAEYRRAVEALCSLLYVDAADRPDLEATLEKAAGILAGQGARVVPILLAQMQATDIKSHFQLALILGRIGPAALGPLRDLLATAEDPYTRTFILYALGKMTCPEVARALPEVIGGLMHPDKEVRDTAARALGKIGRAVPPKRLTTRMRLEMFEALVRASRDVQAPVRAKAIRSLGKLASAGLLDGEQRRKVAQLARGALGESDSYVWDNAFIVRREALETLAILETATGRP